MIDAFEAARRWKKLKIEIDKIKDSILKESILAEYQQRAIQEWGFCPENKRYTQRKIELLPWEEVFLKKIKSCLEYGVFIVDEEVEKEARARMRDYISKGGMYSDLPEFLQNKAISDLYHDVLIEEIDLCIKSLESLEKKPLQDSNKNV